MNSLPNSIFEIVDRFTMLLWIVLHVTRVPIINAIYFVNETVHHNSIEQNCHHDRTKGKEKAQADKERESETKLDAQEAAREWRFRQVRLSAGRALFVQRLRYMVCDSSFSEFEYDLRVTDTANNHSRSSNSLF